MASPNSVAAALAFGNSTEHLLAELERIDFLIQAHVSYARQLQKGDDFRGLYISEQEIDDLLARPAGRPRWANQALANSEFQLHEICVTRALELKTRALESSSAGVWLPLLELERRFGLTRFEMDAVLLCLAFETDARYERLYAYLQDDVTRKRPSVDLILNLLCPNLEQRLEARAYFEPDATLMHRQILVLTEDQDQSRFPLTYRSVQLDDRISSYLFGKKSANSSLIDGVKVEEPKRGISTLILPAETTARITSLVEVARANPATIFYLQGPPGVGKKSVAEALCNQLGMTLLIADLEYSHLSTLADFQGWLRLVQREAILRDSGIYFSSFDALLRDEHRAVHAAFLQAIEQHRGFVLLAGDSVWEPGEMPAGITFARVSVPFPDYAGRLLLWSRACQRPVPEEWIRELAGKYRLSGGQIRDAAATAYQLALAAPEQTDPTLADFQEACRLHSNRRLTALARRIRPHYRWKDIVLPADRIEQLQEICATLAHRAMVYGDWGFEEKLSLGKGLNVLFTGPSGTGKTMAAEILAGELGLELYKTDLSTIVSKYIGETEKNLSRIFAEAASSNAILFFDEADALFGRRSEVRDSHDRYANIEVNYLLQEMERYEGMAILATNLRKNMDEAFVRRMQFVVEFPFPNAKDRLRIWEGALPKDTPRSPDLDLEFLANSFEMTGGNLKNIALSAAFLAASDGGLITMAQLIRATRREYQKMGKVLSGDEFGKYSALAGIGLHRDATGVTRTGVTRTGVTRTDVTRTDSDPN